MLLMLIFVILIRDLSREKIGSHQLKIGCHQLKIGCHQLNIGCHQLKIGYHQLHISVYIYQYISWIGELFRLLYGKYTPII